MEVWCARFWINVGINALCDVFFQKSFVFVVHRCPPYCLTLFVTWIKCFITCVRHGVSKHTFDAIVMLDPKVVHSTGKFDRKSRTKLCLNDYLRFPKPHSFFSGFFVLVRHGEVRREFQLACVLTSGQWRMSTYQTTFSTTGLEKSVDIIDFVDIAMST